MPITRWMLALEGLRALKKSSILPNLTFFNTSFVAGPQEARESRLRPVAMLAGLLSRSCGMRCSLCRPETQVLGALGP